MKRLKLIWIYPLAALLMAAPSSLLSADEYVIGPEDVLAVSFWQDPSLNAQVRVGLDGNISLDIIGQVQAAGRTTEQLENDIVRLMSRLNQNISQSTVRVVEYNYNHVFVIGQVNDPGKKTFEQIPDLWTIINESGGLTEIGDLSRVTIIRGGDRAGEVEVVNVRQALTSGTLDRLPEIRRGDTIEIGRAPGQVTAGEIGRITEKKNLFYVIGAVSTPGPVSYEENIDVLEALALAGGPTSEADLSGVQLVIKDGNYAQATEIDLRKYTETGRPARYIVQKEDMVYVPGRRPGFFDTTLGRIASVLTAVSATYLLIDQVQSE